MEEVKDESKMTITKRDEAHVKEAQEMGAYDVKPQLKFCPFCKGDVVLDDYEHFIIRHKENYRSCPLMIDLDVSTREQAITAWNHRADDKLREVQVRLRTMIELHPDFAKVIDEDFWELLA